MVLKAAGKDVLIESMGSATTGKTPDIVALSDGRMVMVWTENLNQPSDASDDTDGAIFGRILNSDGSPDGDIFQVNEAQTFLQDRPHVVALDNGGFVVGWTSNALFGDTTEDSDTFIKLYGTIGGELVSAGAIDLLVDNPNSGNSPSETANQKLHELVTYDNDRVIAIMETGETYIINTSTEYVGQLQGRGTTDIVLLENGNIVMAGPDDIGQKLVKLVMSDADFVSPPTGIDGIYEPLTFYLEGSKNIKHSIAEIELVALKGGGFVVAYSEQIKGVGSTIRLTVLNDEAAIEFNGKSLPSQFKFDSPKAEFDMIALASGGFALAMVVQDAGATTTGIDILLYNEAGELVTRLQATDSNVENQAAPGLTQLADGTLVMSYTDTSDLITAGETNGMRVAFFDVDGAAGKFSGSDGDDVLLGLSGHDVIAGLGGDDLIKGGGGNDRLYGGEGADDLRGGAGKDALRGGQGDDTLDGGTGNDGLGGGAGDDTLDGGEGQDVLGGGAGSDVVRGGGGDDVVKGGSGDDRLFGNDGNDVLKGGSGDDRLTGGNGADVFVFFRGGGSDTVTDFDEAADSVAIQLRGLKQSSVSVDLNGTDTEITFGSNVITLEDVQLTEAEITFEFF